MPTHPQHLLHPLRALAGALLCLAAPLATAQSGGGIRLDENALRAFVTQRIAAADSGIARFEIEFGPVVPPADLALCRRAEPFASAGMRPWGRASLGVRCIEGAAWTLLVPMTIRAWGPALVAAAPLAAGTTPGAADVREESVEWTREPAAPLRDAAQLQGRTLTRALAPGQPLRADMLRAATVVQAGDPVRLQIQGRGFAIAATGQALAAAGAGQPVRVKTEYGRVLTGVAREGRVVEVSL